MTELSTEDRLRREETNDCTVIALSNAARISYLEAWMAMRDAGRPPGRGLNILVWLPVFEEYVDMVPQDDLCRKKVSTLLKELPKKGTFVIRVYRHVLVYMDGEVFGVGRRCGAIATDVFRVRYRGA